jgi:hypothetical protein
VYLPVATELSAQVLHPLTQSKSRKNSDLYSNGLKSRFAVAPGYFFYYAIERRHQKQMLRAQPMVPDFDGAPLYIQLVTAQSDAPHATRISHTSSGPPKTSSMRPKCHTCAGDGTSSSRGFRRGSGEGRKRRLHPLSQLGPSQGGGELPTGFRRSLLLPRRSEPGRKGSSRRHDIPPHPPLFITPPRLGRIVCLFYTRVRQSKAVEWKPPSGSHVGPPGFSNVEWGEKKRRGKENGKVSVLCERREGRRFITTVLYRAVLLVLYCGSVAP